MVNIRKVEVVRGGAKSTGLGECSIAIYSHKTAYAEKEQSFKMLPGYLILFSLLYLYILLHTHGLE